MGETALHRSAAAGQISACRALLTHGADISLRSFQGHTAAEVASEPVQKILQGKKQENSNYNKPPPPKKKALPKTSPPPQFQMQLCLF